MWVFLGWLDGRGAKRRKLGREEFVGEGDGCMARQVSVWTEGSLMGCSLHSADAEVGGQEGKGSEHLR